MGMDLFSSVVDQPTVYICLINIHKNLTNKFLYNIVEHNFICVGFLAQCRYVTQASDRNIFQEKYKIVTIFLELENSQFVVYFLTFFIIFYCFEFLRDFQLFPMFYLEFNY